MGAIFTVKRIKKAADPELSVYQFTYGKKAKDIYDKDCFLPDNTEDNTLLALKSEKQTLKDKIQFIDDKIKAIHDLKDKDA